MSAENDKVYKIIELVGSSPISFEKAVETAVEKASKTLNDLRIVEVIKFDCRLEDNKIVAYRARVKISFKYHD